MTKRSPTLFLGGLITSNIHFSSEKMDWETPKEFFNTLVEEFTFSLDVCASNQNAKCTPYFTPEDDGLSKEWVKYVPIGGYAWMNPPYGREISKWMRKA